MSSLVQATHAGTAEHKRASQPQAPRRQTAADKIFPGGPPALRKPACACGGGCPRCQAAAPTLKIGEPNDPYEQEADRVADEVMRMPESAVGIGRASAPQIQRLCQHCGEEPGRKPLEDEEGGKVQIGPFSPEPPLQRDMLEEDEEKPLQAKAEPHGTPGLRPETEAAIHSLPGRGQPLPEPVRAFMEPRFNADFRAVRIHTDATAHDLNRAVNARAFTVGRDVAFGAGQYQPETSQGRRLIAHELAHVVQQGGTGVPGSPGPAAGLPPPIRRSILQRQAFRDCTPARTGRPGSAQADIDATIRQALDLAHAWVGDAARMVAGIQGGNAGHLPILQRHFGALGPAQIGTLLARLRQMESRLARAGLVICNSAGSFYCRPPRGWCAYTDCPSSGGYTHLCPPFFQDPAPCAEPDRGSIMVHEAARAAGACPPDVQPGPGYPPANALANVFSYSGFVRDAQAALAPPPAAASAPERPALTPPAPERPRLPSLIEGVISGSERRMRERVLESVEGLLPRPDLHRQADAGHGAGPAGAEDGTPAAEPIAPYYVSFVNVAPPTTPSTGDRNPGGGAGGADRAGLTRATVQKRLTVAWDNGPRRDDGRVPFFARSANVYFRLDPIAVLVSSDYPAGSCPYRATLDHEMTHVSAFLRLFHSYRPLLIRRLNRISLPTEQAPIWLAPADIADEQDRLGEAVAGLVREVSAELTAAMEADRMIKDSAASYARVYARCRPEEWNP